MTKDPVCGMEIDERKAAATATQGGRTYYFCSTACKSMFDKDPQKYVGQAQRGSQGKHS